MFLNGFLIGLFIGANIGLFTAATLVSAKLRDNGMPEVVRKYRSEQAETTDKDFIPGSYQPKPNST